MKYKTLIYSSELKCKECGQSECYFLRVWRGEKFFIIRKCRECVNEEKKVWYESHREEIIARQLLYDKRRKNAIL